MSDNKLEPQEPAEENKRDKRDDKPSLDDEAAAEAELFYKRLEQTGRLVDIDENTDLASLPPHVTHIRHPDGTVERLGYS